MLKRQLNLNLNGTLRANRIWSTIPAGSQQEIVEYYARLIGAAAKCEEVNGEEVNDEEVNDEEVNDEEVNGGPTRQRWER